MATFIKTGFWERAQRGYEHWLNLDLLIKRLITEESITEAPIDGMQYGRQDGEWTVVENSGSSALQPGDNISLLTNDVGYITSANLPSTKSQFNSQLTDGDFLFVGDITQYTAEDAQDAVGIILNNSSTINLIYADNIPSIIATVKSNSISENELTSTIPISTFINDEGFEDTAQLNTRSANDRNRANHTGTQTIATIVNLQTILDGKENIINKNEVNGYAGLDSSGKIFSSQLPPLAITDTFVVNSQVAMLALTTAETGDIAVRTDINMTFILKGTNPSVLSDWQVLLSPTDVVTSVFGRTGAVSANPGDYDTSLVPDTLNKRYVTDANLITIGNQSGINTGDNSVNTNSNAYADSKVEDLIVNGVTTKAPSQNVVFDALDIKTENSAGALQGFAITNNGDGTVNIATGTAYLRATNDQYAPLLKYTIPAVTNLALTNDANNFILVDYNAGVPAITVTTNSSTINTETNSLLALISRVGTTLDYLSLVGQNNDANGKIRIRFLNQEGIRRANGVTLGFINRNLTLTAGTLFSGLIRINSPAFNTVSPDTFTYVYNNGAVWTRVTGQTQVNNTQYNNTGVLTTMPNNTFRVDYIYLLPNNPSKLYVIYGNTTYNNITLARNAPAPSSLPTELQVLGLLVGRQIIEKNAATISEVTSAFADVFTNTGVPEHNALAGIQGGAVNDYQHLTTAEKALIHNPVTIGTANGLSLATQVLSLGVASTSTTGALSSTDWNTFNNKQPLLTNPVTGTGTINFVSKWTSSSAQGNANIFDNGTNIGIGTSTSFPGYVTIIGGSSVLPGLAVQNGSAQGSIRIGADVNTTTLTSGVRKYAVITTPPLTNGASPILVLASDNNTTGENLLHLGGRVGSAISAATKIMLTTAPDQTSTVPVSRMEIDSVGAITLTPSSVMTSVYSVNMQTIKNAANYSNTGTVTGSIVIKHDYLTSQQTMFDFKVKIYQFNSTRSSELRFTFYGSNATINTGGKTGYCISSNGTFPVDKVDVGFDSTGKLSIMIGDVGTVWGTNTRVEIDEITTSFTFGGEAAWRTGWTIALDTTLTGYTGIQAISLPISIVGVGTTTDLYTSSSGALATPPTQYLFANSSATDGTFSMMRFSASRTSGQSAVTYLGTVNTAVNYESIFVIGRRTGLSSYAESLRINHLGNVGIGTDNPTAPVDVFGAQNTRIINVASNLTPDSGVTMSQGVAIAQVAIGGGAGYALTGYQVNSTSSTGIVSQVALNADIGTIPLITLQGNQLNNAGAGATLVTTRPILGINNYTTRLATILANGLVGIATPTPNYNLHLNSTTTSSFMQFTSTTTGTTSSDGFIIGSGSSGEALIINRENAQIAFHTNNTEKMRIGALGGVSIGNTTDLGASTLNVTGNITTIAGTTANHAVIKSQLDAAVSGAISNTVTSASTLTLAVSSPLVSYYVFTGTTATWTLPTPAGNTTKKLALINTGSGTVTVNTNAGALVLYNGGLPLVATYALLSGSNVELYSDGTRWIVL